MNSNLAEITAAYENGWNKLTEQFYTKQEWPEAETIAPLVGEGRFFARTNAGETHFDRRSCIFDSLPGTVLQVRLGTLFLIDIDSTQAHLLPINAQP